MQKFLKSAVAIAAMVVVGTSAFAADKLTAKLKITGSLYGTDGFKMDNTKQGDYDDTFFLSYSADKVGADFRIGFPTLTSNAPYLNNTSIWVKPVDGLKVTFGQNDIDRYKEQIDWWRSPSGWVTSDGNGGFKFDITPAPELAIQANVTPGLGNAFLGYDANTIYGVNVSYNVAGLGKPRLAWADKGLNGAKQITVGTDINAIPGLYAFENIGIGFTSAFAYSQVAFDTYIAYTAGQFNIKGYFPLTFTAAGAGSVMIDVRPAYKVDTVELFARFTNSQANGSFAAFVINPEIRLGADTNVDKVYLEAYLKLTNLTAGTLNWSIPFTVKLSF